MQSSDAPNGDASIPLQDEFWRGLATEFLSSLQWAMGMMARLTAEVNRLRHRVRELEARTESGSDWEDAAILDAIAAYEGSLMQCSRDRILIMLTILMIFYFSLDSACTQGFSLVSLG